jgi:hypothetical protein
MRKKTMSNEERAFLMLARYPAFLTLLQTCWLLGLALHQGHILVRRGLLVPTGKRRHRKSQLFARAYILELVDDREWLSKAKDALSLHWEQTNLERRKNLKASTDQ